MGTVYAATHQNNGHRVAIKVLHPEFSRDEDTRSRFLQEGYAANQVSHHGVVRILDDDILEDGSAFLVMELLEGELLERRRVRKGGRLDLSEMYDIADQLLDVLSAAHDKGIVHRDIKPDNLFITNQNKLKVLDFGFAQMKTGFRREQTATGFLLGTPGFMSPEQAVGNRAQIDAQTDVWAVGATLFTCLSGEPVHAAESAAEMLVAAANFPCRSLATLEPGLPPYLVKAVDRALAFDKNERWPNARAMQLALRAVPGRRTNDVFESGQRVVPANSEATIEEIDSIELIEAAPSWHMHPADDDGPTITGQSLQEEQAPMTPHMSQRPGQVHAAEDGGTLIMESPARPREQMRSGDFSSQGYQPTGFSPTNHAYQPPPVHEAMIATGPQFAIQRPTARAKGTPNPGSRILVFIGVAVVSMIIVVVTGLVVLAASD